MKVNGKPVPTPIVSSSTQMVMSSEKLEKQAPVAITPLVVDMGDIKIELFPHELAKVVDKLNETARIFSQSLRFEMTKDQDIKVKVIDSLTGAVVKEIPPEKVIEVHAQMADLLGLLLDVKV